MLKFRGSSHFIWGLIHRMTQSRSLENKASTTNGQTVRSSRQSKHAKSVTKVEHFHNNPSHHSSTLSPSTIKKPAQTRQISNRGWTLSQQPQLLFQHAQPVYKSHPSVTIHHKSNTFKFTPLFHMFLLATRHRVCGLDSQLSESNLPRTHTVVRLRFKGKEVQDPLPSDCRTPINWWHEVKPTLREVCSWG